MRQFLSSRHGDQSSCSLAESNQTEWLITWYSGGYLLEAWHYRVSTLTRCQYTVIRGGSKSYLQLLSQSSYLSRSQADCWGTTVDFITIFLHSLWFSAFCSMMFLSRPVHSLMLSSHRFLCLPLRLPLWTVPCRIVLASPDNRVMSSKNWADPSLHIAGVLHSQEIATTVA